ncbi:MAG TPA: exodeoxyribonuclease VII large subunit, partial [Cytophagales bacterium]|nr:exodeoxyribonuclease VII large subunit [Cytophagales bacterium]
MQTPLTLAELNTKVKSTLEEQLEPSYWVIAEIGSMQVAQRGHAYLELVEKQDEQITAKLRANIWAYTYRVVSGWFQSVTGSPLQAGLKVLVHGVVTYHEVYGLSLNIKDIDPNFTLGERARQRMEVLQKLEADGVLEMNQELALPLVPQRIAVVSSATAAGYEDFMEQITHNGYGYRVHTQLFRAVMQGDQATESIIGALHEVHNAPRPFDAVVIIRGGGSQLDLDCFDTYELAATVAQFPLPVITGIGHERDETIVDMVAHTRMKTPTAVAEFLIQGLRAFEENVLLLEERLQQYTQRYVNEQSLSLSLLSQRIGAAS